MVAPPLRYVVLRHDGVANPHFDLMFETSPGSPLATWRSIDWPIKPGERLEFLADHRNAYLDYEGPVSNNRGHVRRVAGGVHTIVRNDIEQFQVKLDTGEILAFPRK